jgi:hypothetical protein
METTRIEDEKALKMTETEITTKELNQGGKQKCQ